MGFGANIRKLRTMEHLGQAQLAEMLGVSKETVCRWEKSRYAPRERHIEKLQALFGCTRDELVGEENGLAVKLAKKKNRHRRRPCYPRNGGRISRHRYRIAKAPHHAQPTKCLRACRRSQASPT